jgi:hypothetical protein
MDLVSLTLTGLVAIGTVNVISFFKPDLDSKVKFFLSFLVAFAVAFVPPAFSAPILVNVRLALEAALAASGTYKLAQKVGGQ